MQICGGGGNRTLVRNAYIQCTLPFSPPCKAKSCGMSLPALHVCSPNSPRGLSLQYRSYLRPIIRWHYGSIDYLDPLLYSCLRGYYLCRINPSQIQPYAVTLLRLVTPPGLVIIVLQRCISPLQD